MRIYPHHISDFNNATRHLTRVERSLYRDLLEIYYETERQLTLDLPALCRKIVANECSTDVQRLLNEFFTETPTGWYHVRCEAEIDAYRSNNSQRALAGKASAKSKALKKQLAINGGSTADQRPLNSVATDSNDTSTKKQNLNLNLKPVKELIPIGMSGDAAVKRPKTTDEFRKSELWRSIKSLLVETGEAKDLKAAGAIITKVITRFDEPTALAAIEATLYVMPAGVIAYLEGACQQASGRRPNKQEVLEAGNLAAAERFSMS